jgi:hypothetical protein
VILDEVGNFRLISRGLKPNSNLFKLRYSDKSKCPSKSLPPAVLISLTCLGKLFSMYSGL